MIKVASLVILLFFLQPWPGFSVTTRESRHVGRFSQFEARRITNAISNRIKQLSYYSSYSSGRSFSYTFMVTDRIKASIRLWFFSIAPSRIYTLCSISPDKSMILSTQTLQQAYWEIFSTIYTESQAHGYGSMIVFSKLFAIDYISWEGQPDKEELWSVETTDNSSLDGHDLWNESAFSLLRRDAVPGDPDLAVEDCWPFATSMISGHGSVGSFFMGPYILESKNQKFKALIRSDCYFVLYEWRDGLDGKREVWNSGRVMKNRRASCSISLQVDSNMVIVDNWGRKPQFAFAFNVYCKPQPNCVRTAGLSVEDDGYIVVWETDNQRELWRVPPR
ncbi:hypothetical protein SELMODRAFT_402485 [Selaginella moellendorffii]|uniref:Bulb-type lectin domain-containing protein n=1 Tax=Selaginella moellendorffii TaxID=88036 RepID=D8QQT0_SELML|nr:hypothetical protein SELMODRAFT_402485 [Selaginella moellendorffii]